MILWISVHLGSPLNHSKTVVATTLYLMLDFPPLEIHSFVEAGQSSQVSNHWM